jgi:hypothetical protein
MNISAGSMYWALLKNFIPTSLILVLDSSKKALIPSLNLYRCVHTRYISSIEIIVKSIQGWYYLRSLPGWYKAAGICPKLYQLGAFLDTSVDTRR